MLKILSITILMLLASCQFKNEDQGSSLVAGHTPTTNSFNVQNPSSGIYRESQNIDFYFNFPYPVIVTGTPRLALNIGGVTRYANYTSGSNSDELLFRYTVTVGDNDNDGITAGAAIELNGGTLTFTGTQGVEDAALSLSIPSLSSVRVDTSSPTISVSAPTAGTYYRDLPMNFTVTASEAVVVSGTPRLTLTLDSGVVFANYVSGSGTTNLTFRFVAGVAHVDTNGIVVQSPLDLNGGVISDVAGNLAILTFAPPVTTSVLVDGPRPIVSSVILPTNKTYLFNESIDFTLRFNEVVNVIGGSPRINLTVGSTTRFAQYISGSGTQNLVFRHIVQGGDLDTDGVELIPLINLNGAGIRNASNVDAHLVFLPVSTPNVLVSAPAPKIQSFIHFAGTYSAGSSVYLTAIFDTPVTVTGIPQLSLDVGGQTRFANYDLGSGSTNIRFTYTVAPGDNDADGITITSPALLSGGSIRDATLVDADLTFTAPNTSDLIVQSSLASISSVTAPANGNYNTGSNLDFTVNFSEAVTVNNSSFVNLVLDIGGASRQASYLSGSGSSSLVFRYTVTGPDVDLDGISVSSPLSVVLPGTIQDSLSNSAGLTFTPPDTSAILVNMASVAPYVLSITPPANDTYRLGDFFDFSLEFSENVFISGTPRLALQVGSFTRYATYLSGNGSSTITFRYSVTGGDSDANGIELGTVIDLNGGSIRDTDLNDATLTLTPPDLSGVLVDAVSLSITSLSAPASQTYLLGETLSFTATTSENAVVTGTPRIALTIGSTTRYATYSSGSGSTSLVFTYTVQASDEDNDGIQVSTPVDLNGGTLQNSLSSNFTLNFTAPDTSAVLVDTVAPTITSVTSPSLGSYRETQQLNFTVNFSENVTFTSVPRLTLTIGAVTRYATYVSGSGTSSAIFRYTIAGGDSDTDGITLASPVDLNGGSISDAASNNAILIFTPPSMTTVLVDTTAPTITSITPPSAGTYTPSIPANFVVNFSEAVTLTGSPRITLNVGGETRYATYQSGPGTSNVTFRYTPIAGDNDLDGITSSSPLGLNGGTIADSAGNSAVLTFTIPDTSSVNIDSAVPTITGFTPPSDDTYIMGEVLDFSVTFSEPVIVIGSPQLRISVGSLSREANYFSGSGTSTLLFRYSIVSSDVDADGIAITSPLDLNGGTIRDSVLLDADLTFSPPSTIGVLIDGVLPEITSVIAPSDGIYSNSVPVIFVVTFSKNVTATGTPRIPLTVGNSTGYANYIAGSGSNSLLFSYIPATNHFAYNGIDFLGSSLELNGGSIRDINGTDSNLSYSALPSVLGIKVAMSTNTRWFDVTDSNRVTTSSDGVNDVIDSITDKISGSVNLSASGTARPRYFPSGFGSENRPFAQFNGTSNVLTMSSNQIIRSIVIIFRSQSNTTDHRLFNQTTGGINKQYTARLTAGNLMTSNGTTNRGDFLANDGTLTGNSLVNQAWNWSTNTNYVLVMPYSNNGDTSTTLIGSTSFNGRIVEILIFSSKLSNLQAREIASQFNAKHGIY